MCNCLQEIGVMHFFKIFSQSTQWSGSPNPTASKLQEEENEGIIMWHKMGNMATAMECIEFLSSLGTYINEHFRSYLYWLLVYDAHQKLRRDLYANLPKISS